MSGIVSGNHRDQLIRSLNAIIGFKDAVPVAKDYEKKLEEVYRFPIDEPLKALWEINPKYQFDIKGKDEIFENTLLMRGRLKAFLASDDESERDDLAKWIIENWGGITSGKSGSEGNSNVSSLKSAVHTADAIAEKGGDKFKFDRIASWSKYLAFKNPGEFAIYDARVIYSLNWLLYLAGAPKYLPFPAGRNSVMGLLNYELFIFMKSSESMKAAKELLETDYGDRRRSDSGSSQNRKSSFVRNLKKDSDLFIKESKAFREYCDLLKDISTGLFGNDADRLTKTEMLLFSIADAEIAKSVLEYVTTHITRAATVSP